MTPEQFCYWLQGFGELGTEPPTPEQWQSIKEHLATAFRKVTPPGPGQLVPNVDWQRAGLPYQATQITC
jgi:hypothetical protein